MATEPHPSRESGAAPGLALRGLIGGRVHLPGDAEYDAARLPWNVAVDQRPAAVAVPRSAAEVAAVVRRAAEAGLRVAPQGTGHNARPLASRGLDDVVIIRTSAMNSAIADPERGIVRVEGGTIWESAVDAAAAYGKAVLHGSSPDVGIAGSSLGGGIGWYGRQHGLASNSISAIEIVVADGTLVRADADTDPELFWAVRGGGGSFGVVTAIELKLFDIATAYAGMLVWPLAAIEPVLREWSAWAPTAADEITTSFRAMRFPDRPDVPDLVRGQHLVLIDGAVVGDDERGEELIAGLRALRPVADTFGRVPAKSLIRLHMDREGGAPIASHSTMLESFPGAAVDAFLAAAGPDAETSLVMAELRQLGGALSRQHEGGGVLSRLDSQFLGFALGAAATTEVAARTRADAVRFTEALQPFAAGTTLLNFIDVPVDTRAAYDADTWARLIGIRSGVDPDGVFVANHPVPRLEENDRPAS